MHSSLCITAHFSLSRSVSWALIGSVTVARHNFIISVFGSRKIEEIQRPIYYQVIKVRFFFYFFFSTEARAVGVCREVKYVRGLGRLWGVMLTSP